MKKKLNIATALLFGVAFFLNFSFDSKGNFRLINRVNAYVLPTYKGPSPWYCYTDGKVTSTLQVCTDEGTTDCTPIRLMTMR